MNRRGLRLELVRAIVIALALPALAVAAQNAPSVAPQSTLTTLVIESRGQAGRTTANMTATVAGEDRLPATGAVTFSDNGRPLAGAALDAQGQATVSLALPAGGHVFTATYSGDPAHRASVSQDASAQAQAASTADFQISVDPATLSLTAGQSGNIAASVTPENSSALTAPMFVTLSCSGLPDQASCVFTPENIEILPNATAAINSSMVVLTQQQEGFLTRPSLGGHRASGISLAILLPGAFGLAGLAWSVRRRPWLQRLSLLGLVALVAMLGATACNSRYNYYNHGPPPNPATPAGTYTIDVTAQSSNGITAITHSTTFALTVK